MLWYILHKKCCLLYLEKTLNRINYNRLKYVFNSKIGEVPIFYRCFEDALFFYPC